MKQLNRNVFVILIFVLAIFPVVSAAMTTDELKVILNQEGKVTIIDARNRLDYGREHIVNAINIPADILLNKQLPPIGKVVVYGDGIQKETILGTVEALNARPGIEADYLEGGFPAWASHNFPRSQWFGVKRENFRSISFQDLKRADTRGNSDIVLVDLRHIKRNDITEKTAATDEAQKDFSDLTQLFPTLSVISPVIHFTPNSKKSSGTDISGLSTIPHRGHDNMYILIDVGDGTAQKVARRLKAKGISQFAILIGGEKILKTNGRSGMASDFSKY